MISETNYKSTDFILHFWLLWRRNLTGNNINLIKIENKSLSLSGNMLIPLSSKNTFFCCSSLNIFLTMTLFQVELLFLQVLGKFQMGRRSVYFGNQKTRVDYCIITVYYKSWLTEGIKLWRLSASLCLTPTKISVRWNVCLVIVIVDLWLFNYVKCFLIE